MCEDDTGVHTVQNGESIPIKIAEPDKLRFKEVAFSNLPSPHMSLSRWLDLAAAIDELIEDENVLGAVVLHGTDLLPECSLVLELCLKTGKPVVITGSMRSRGEEGYDGVRNLENAIRICLALPPGSQVMATMADEIYPARHVLKKNSVALASMSSQNGLVGRVYGDDVIFFHAPPAAPYYLIDPGRIDKATLPYVALIAAAPGQDGKLVDHLLQTGVQGLVIEGFGAGNLPAELASSARGALAKNLPVLLTTRCFEGGVYPIYSYPGGAREMLKHGALLCGNIPSAKAFLILQIALACKISPAKILDFFN